MPRFSVVIPTKDRSSLATTIWSVLRQDHDDCEVVVVDNSSVIDHSKLHDETRSRVRWERTGGLNMVDNWEAAYDLAGGD